MAVKAVVNQSFEGGWSIDKKVGIKNSQEYTQALDFRKSPSQMTVLPGLTREDNNVVIDLVQNEVMAQNGNTYSIGSAGNFYKRSTAGVWSNEAKLGIGTFGLDYRQDTDSIYIPTNKHVSQYANVTTAPVMNISYYGPSYSTYNNSTQAGFNVNAFQQGSILTYAPPTSIIENNTNKRFFQSDIEPLNQISIYVVNKGTGDWTLTLHDGINNVLGTATITNANLINGQFNNFVFSSATNGQVRIYVAPSARTYHIHVTSTVTDGSLSCSKTNDLSTCDLEVWADRLIQPRNGMHPVDRFLQYEIIGNSNYVSVWEPLSDPPTNDEWLRHKLVFPSQYEVCGLAHTNEYEVIALEQNTTSTTSVPQEGLIAFWDGSSTTYNYYLTIPEGSPYGLHTYQNIVYYYAGGDWYALTSPTTLPVKIWHMPGSDTEFSSNTSPIIVYPNAATVRRGVQLMAYPCSSTNTGINFGVYSWGAVDKNFPQSFGYNYLISTGTQNYSVSNNLTIGMVKNFGDILHVSWRDTLNGGYGVDVITNSSVPASTAIWQGLIFDNGYVGKRKEGLYVECYYSLPAGATIQLGYSIDRGAFVNDTNLYSSTNLWQGITGYARFSISPSTNGGLFYECQPQIIIQTNSVTTPPVIYMTGLVFDDRAEETRE